MAASKGASLINIQTSDCFRVEARSCSGGEGQVEVQVLRIDEGSGCDSGEEGKEKESEQDGTVEAVSMK